MERDFYVNTDRFGEEHVVEERTADEIIEAFKKLEHGNEIRVIWHLVDSMKRNYEQAKLFYVNRQTEII